MCEHLIRRRRQYEYKPLSKGFCEIRLLTVFPATSLSSNIIRSSIRRVSLSDVPKPTYETISYVWGDQAKRGTIMVDEAELDCPLSCERAIHRMRLEAENRTLWIDAVCINQKDVEERGQQVSIMDKVYINAVRNLVWLGEGGHGTKGALRAMDLIFEDARDETDNFNEFEQTVFDRERLEWRRSKKALVINESAVRRCLDLFQNPWFERLWVVQEAALAPESVCHLGQDIVPLTKLLTVARWLKHKLDSPDFIKPFTGMRKAAVVWKYVNGLYRENTPPGPDMLNLLDDVARFQTSEARDRVYGLIGLYQKYRPTSNVPALLLPDYKKPKADVFRDATRFAIGQRGDLNYLDNLRHSMGRPAFGVEWPSWVPHWDLFFDVDRDPSELVRKFRTCGDEVHRASDVSFKGPDFLAVRGYLYDTVDQTDWRITRSTPLGESHRTLRNVAALEEYLHVSRCTTSGGLFAIACTLCAGVDHSGQRVSPEMAVQGYNAWLTDSRAEAWWAVQSLSTLPQIETEESRNYHKAVARACVNRSLFTTKRGALGAGPNIMRAGDFVAVLFGCQWPVILRLLPVEGEYNILGVAYVHGIMDGEVVESARESGLEVDMFYLR